MTKNLEISNLNLGETIRFVRERRGLSARALSIAAELSPSYISKIENGSIEPSLKSFASICRVLKLNDAEIVFIVRFLS